MKSWTSFGRENWAQAMHLGGDQTHGAEARPGVHNPRNNKLPVYTWDVDVHMGPVASDAPGGDESGLPCHADSDHATEITNPVLYLGHGHGKAPQFPIPMP